MADDEGTDEGTGDLDQEDMDDLGELGGDDDADEGDDDAKGKGDDGKEWKPPTKSQWERAQRRLKKYASERKGDDGADVDKKLRDQLTGGKGKDDEDGDDDAASARAEAAKWRLTAARQSAATQLAAAGFNGTATQAARLTRLMDLEDAKPDRSGVFDFEDEVDDLKEEYPELFGAKGARRNEQREGRRPNTTPVRGQERKNATDRTTAALLKAGGY